MDKIWFQDFEMKSLMENTGLSKLELLGVIAEMNKIWEPKMSILRYHEEQEKMGRNI